MLYATNRFAGDGATTQYAINFVGGYLDRSHVKAYVEDASLNQASVPITQANFLGPFTIGGLTPVPVGSTIVIYRDTPKEPLVDFTNGSRFTEANLDISTRQGAFIAAEGADAVSPTGLDGFLQQVVGFSEAAGVARDEAVAAQDTVVAASAAASLSESNANDSALSAAADAASAMTNKILSDTAAFDASASASEALGYRNTAQTAATNASASESTATTQAGIATTQATAAAASATAAAASAASIAAGPVASVNGRAGVVVLAKADVGLSNVDNTSDDNKPVSTPQATALAAKVARTDVVGTFNTVTGTANALVLAVSPVGAATATLRTGTQVRFRASAANTGATTINWGGTGVKSCVTVTGVALPAGYIRTDVDTVATYDGTYFVLQREIEEGSNANGSYTRFASGKMFCIIRTATSTTDAPYGYIFSSPQIGPLTPPAYFIATPASAGNAPSSEAVWVGVLWTAVIYITAYCGAQPRAFSDNINVSAQGLWY